MASFLLLGDGVVLLGCAQERVLVRRMCWAASQQSRVVRGARWTP